ncbi:hypothetical protein AKJ09_00263 [Labilithrix luteola]|uniref:Type IV fimbrial biogenesis protein PilY1 n=1 Tax=Labilithrix luteola TaxID=1391654 RepID=A0A0K1PKG4_9BACT|nr:hypothetical protein [Labilithrix luteola]AKU93599.1 hypothetical protein AKJ09_00263 [Labilithrix luteola]
MKLSLRNASIATTIAWALAQGVIACADADSTEPTSETSEKDASSETPSTTLPSSDATTSNDAADAAADAPADGDADIDAGNPMCTTEGWCTTDAPVSEWMNGVYNAGDGTAWAVSEQGNVLRFDGHHWAIHTALTVGAPLPAIIGRGPTDVWTGNNKGLWHSEVVADAGPGDGGDAGASNVVWTPFSLSEPINIMAMWASPAGDLYLAGTTTVAPVGKTRVFSMAAGTNTWVVDPLISARTDLNEPTGGVVSSNGDVWMMVMATGATSAANRIVHRRSQPSVMWIDEAPVFDKLPNASFWGIGIAGDKIFISTKTNYSNACYYVGTDNGPVDDAGVPTMTWTRGTWLDPTMSDNSARTGVWGAAANDVWTAGENGQINHFDGTKWRIAHTSIDGKPIVVNLTGMHAISNDDIWVVGGTTSPFGMTGQGIALHKLSPAVAGGTK